MNDDDIPPFTEARLMSKIFTSRAREKLTRLDKIGGVAMAIGELIRFGIDVWKNRKKPKRADDHFGANPSELERIRDVAGRTMVDEAPSFGPRREDLQ
jgi:hypothetical protein